ncbi:MAG: hypothetical protein EBT95_05495 [Verrucomicrobia bacterium]|nr:hypothetical protein [Verrucomicrobiota bacterium]
MATLTLKDVPEKLHSVLKKQADRHRRSLNLAQPDSGERQAWLKLSEQSLRKAWDHPQDAVYDQLLQK